jgi:hypothetical protein
MSMLSYVKSNGKVRSVGDAAGTAEIPGRTELTRLHYYDGKFLRADDLRAEQDYHRYLVELSNRGGGSGVVYGFDVARGSGDEITIGGGLAFDGEGRTLYMPGSFQVALHDLIAATRGETTKAAPEAGGAAFERCVDAKDGVGTPTGPGGFYVITIAHAEDACGEEDVYGKLCEDACATSTDRPWLVEGVLVRAHEFRPTKPYPSSKVVQLGEKHVRSQLASAWFAQETGPTLISGAGLHSEAWCTGAPKPPNGEVAIAVLATLPSQPWVDEWIVRRERMETPPRRFWDWTMSMRPWAVYLAQILQFQCQLVDALVPQPPGSGTDPCAPYHQAVDVAAKYLAQLEEVAAGGTTMAMRRVEVLSQATNVFTELGGAAKFQKVFGQLKNVLAQAATPSQRILIDGGIVELPAAGYLPVTPGTTPPVEDQVRRLMGDGVDLRFCVVRHDYVAHALEEAQHMDRISLLTGLDDPSQKQQVDIYVPDAQVLAAKAPAQLFFDAKAVLVPRFAPAAEKVATRLMVEKTSAATYLHGASRAEATAAGGAVVYSAVAAEAPDQLDLAELARAFAGLQDTDFVEMAAKVREAEPANASTLGSRARARLRVAASEGTIPSAVPHIAAWAETTCAENPFDLGAGESTQVDLVVDAVASSTVSGLAGVVPVVLGVSAELTGTLAARGPAQVGGGKRTLEADFRGHGVRDTDLSGQRRKHQEADFRFPVTLTQHEDGSEPRLTVELKKVSGSHTLLLEATWSETRPLQITAILLADPPASGKATTKTGIALGGVVETENAGVATASAPLHQTALDAIDLVAKGVKDPALAADAKKKLFPEAAKDGRSIVATQDWVLFQRRRTSDCGPAAAPPPAAVATRRYRVWEIESDFPAQPIRAIEQDDTELLPGRFAAHVVGEVEFPGGTASLVSDASAVVVDWQRVRPEATIAYAAIATDLTDEDDALLLARVKSYEAAVASVSAVTASTVTKRLAALTSLSADRADGVLVFVTTPEPKTETVTYRVFAVRESDAVPAVIKAFQTTGDLRAFFNRLNPTLVGTVSFDLDTPNLGKADFQKLPFGEFGTLVDELVVASLETAPANQPLDDQTVAILKTVHGNKNFQAAVKVGPVSKDRWDFAEPFVTVLIMDIEA